jgi:hypothetical protein
MSAVAEKSGLGLMLSPMAVIIAIQRFLKTHLARVPRLAAP